MPSHPRSIPNRSSREALAPPADQPATKSSVNHGVVEEEVDEDEDMEEEEGME